MQQALAEQMARYEERRDLLNSLELLEARRGIQPRTMTEAISLFKALFAHCPLPAWVKNADGVMLAKNPAYVEIYGKTDEGYIGKVDADQWAKDEVERYSDNDRVALRDGYQVEHEPIQNPVSIRQESLDVVKWAWLLDDGQRLAVGVVSGTRPLPQAARLDGR